MSQKFQQKNRFQLGSITSRQSYFIQNLIHNQPITCANSHKKSDALKKNQRKQSDCKKKIINGLTNELISNCGILTRRSYGQTGFNYETNVQLNNRCSIQDNMISSDVILVNDRKRQQSLKQENQLKNLQEQKLKRQAVDVNKYRNHLRTEEITDAYYFVNEEISKAVERQNIKTQTIKRVKSLSRSKSKQQGLQFRKVQQHKIDCVKQVEKLKEKYTNFVAPSLMGTQNQIVMSAISQNQKSLRKVNSSKNLKSSNLSRKVQQIQHIQSRMKNQQNSVSIQNSSMQLSDKKTSARSTSYQNPILTTRTLLNTKASSNLKSTTNSTSQSLLQVLMKSKSTEDFMKKQRVKVVKQAFVQNWKQGSDKEPQKFTEVYLCKHTQNLKAEKQKLKQKKENQKKLDMFGRNALKRNPIENISTAQFEDQYIKRFDTLKEYQMKFSQISKNKINSCIVAKN